MFSVGFCRQSAVISTPGKASRHYSIKYFTLSSSNLDVVSKSTVISGVHQFLFRRPIFWACNFTCAPDQALKKMGAQNQIVRPIETQLETLLFAIYYLNSTYNLYFWCRKVLTIMFFKCKRTVFIIQTHSSKSVQKNKLKAWDFTKNKFCDRYFDKKLQKIFRTNILENGTGQKLLIVVLMIIGLLLKLQMEIVN